MPSDIKRKLSPKPGHTTIRNGQSFFEHCQSKLVELIENSDDFRKVMRLLSSEQRSIFLGQHKAKLGKLTQKERDLEDVLRRLPSDKPKILHCFQQQQDREAKTSTSSCSSSSSSSFPSSSSSSLLQSSIPRYSFFGSDDHEESDNESDSDNEVKVIVKGPGRNCRIS